MLLSFGIYLQQRDIHNSINLVYQIRNNFPVCALVVYFSGFQPLQQFKLLQQVCEVTNTALVIEPTPRSIGHAMNIIIDKLSTDWVVLFDGDILLTEQAVRTLRKIAAPSNSRVGVIQGYVMPQTDANTWARFDCINDTLAYLKDRTNPTAWFANQELVIPEQSNLSTLHGGIMIVNKKIFLDVGGAEEDTLLVQRALAATLLANRYSLLFIKDLTVRHWYPSTLKAVLARKIFHAWGSALNRLRHPKQYQDSLRIRMAMLVSAFRPPAPFHSLFGRIYFALSMVTFTLALSYYLHKFSKGTFLPKYI